MTDRIQSVNPLLGDEIVFCASLAGTEPVPIVIARVQPGRRAELASALEGSSPRPARLPRRIPFPTT